MASKALLLLCLFVLLAVSEVVVASGNVKSKSEETMQPDHYGGDNGGYNGGGRGGYNGGGGRGGYNGRGYCRHGCCDRGYYRGGCRRCCSYAGEAVQTQPGH